MFIWKCFQTDIYIIFIFQTMFAELDLLAEKLENRDTSLEDSFILYRQGMELLKLCSGKLDTVEKKMLQLNEDGTFSEFSR